MSFIPYIGIREGMWFIIPTVVICWREIFQIEVVWMGFRIGFVIVYGKQTQNP